MIKFQFNISNPFKHQGRLFKDFGISNDWTLSTNKSFEIQIAQFGLQYLFNLDIDLNWKGEDHAGPSITLEILGVYFNAKFYDHRHWDWDNNTWAVYDNVLNSK